MVLLHIHAYIHIHINVYVHTHTYTYIEGFMDSSIMHALRKHFIKHIQLQMWL